MTNDKVQRDPIRELKWKEVMSRVDAYRFYIKICLEANAFFFATTGAILGFYLKEPNTNPYLKFFLLLPILMGAVLGSICLYAKKLQEELSKSIEKIRCQLRDKDLYTEEVPDINLLGRFLSIFGFIFFLVAGLLIAIPFLKEDDVFRWRFASAGAVMGLLVWLFSLNWYAAEKQLRQSQKEEAETEWLKEANLKRERTTATIQTGSSSASLK